MDILERIKMVMKMNQLNAASFADLIGVQRSNVSHVLTGRNKPSLDFIEKILFRFPKVNASWLISGQVQQADMITPVNSEAEMNPGQRLGEVTNVTNELMSAREGKKVIKVITFYEDFTFDEFKPNM